MNKFIEGKFTKIISMTIVVIFCFVFVGHDYVFACDPPPPPPPPNNHGGGGEPIEASSGEFLQDVTDINIPGRGFPIKFQRSYKSRFGYASVLGNWDHNYNIAAKLNIAPQGKAIDMKKYSDGKSYEIYPRIIISFEIKTPQGVNVIFNREKEYEWVPDKDVPSVDEVMGILSDGESITNPKGEFSFWGVPERLKTANATIESLGAEHSKIIKNSDKTITWRKKDGTKFNFSVFKGNMTRISGADGTAWRKQPTAKILSIEDRNGNSLSFQYNNSDYNSPDNRLTAVTDPSNRSLTFTYSEELVEVTDNINRTWEYHFVAGRLVKVVDPLNNYKTYEYDTDGNLISYINERGKEWTYTYDEQNRQATATYPPGHTVTNYFSTYTVVSPFIDTSGGVPDKAKRYSETKFTWPNGDSEIFTYDPVKGATVKKKDPSGLETLYQYDSDGNIIKKIARKGGEDLRTIQYFYDGYGNCVKAVLPEGSIYRWTYENNFNNPTAYYSPTGGTTTYTYDANGNLTEIIGPENNKNTFTYNLSGDLISITDARGNSKSFEYNSYGYITKITFPDGNSREFTYDSVGNLTSATDELNNTGSYDYDLLGRLIKITDPNNNISQFEYDAKGNQTKLIDAENNVTTYAYDEINRLRKVTNVLGNSTQYTYDSIGRLTQVTNALGETTKYEYGVGINAGIRENKLEHNYNLVYMLTKRTDALGNEESYSYDAVGNLISKTDYNGNTTNYTYNNNDWLAKKILPDSSETSYFYDSSGRVSSVTDSNGSISYTYDKRGLPTSISYPNSKTVQYEYDAAGNKTKLIYPDSTEIRYTYDSLNRISTAKDFDGTVSTHTYNDAGRLSKINYANGVEGSFGYDALNRIESLEYSASTTTIYRSTYTYDSVGNKLTKTYKNGERWEYAYDNLYQVTQAVKKDSQDNTLISHAYSYDAVNNRASYTDLSDSKAYTYNSDNQLTSIDDGTNYSYDYNSNMTSKTIGSQTTSYEYDYENRMIEVTLPDLSVNTFDYDPFGRRIQKTDSSGTKNYIWDGIKVITEYDGTDSLINKYSYGINRMVASRKLEASGDLYYYHQDELGSVVLITDSSGNVVNEYEYDDFGNIISQTEGIDNDYTYTGKERDKDTGLYYYGARYYDPVVGRFTSRDPILSIGYITNNIGEPIRLHNYVYTHNNPVNYIDPWGEELISGSIVAIAIMLGVTVGLVIALIASGLLDKVLEKHKERQKQKEKENKEDCAGPSAGTGGGVGGGGVGGGGVGGGPGVGGPGVGPGEGLNDNIWPSPGGRSGNEVVIF